MTYHLSSGKLSGSWNQPQKEDQNPCTLIQDEAVAGSICIAASNAHYKFSFLQPGLVLLALSLRVHVSIAWWGPAWLLYSFTEIHLSGWFQLILIYLFYLLIPVLGQVFCWSSLWKVSLVILFFSFSFLFSYMILFTGLLICVYVDFLILLSCIVLWLTEIP